MLTWRAILDQNYPALVPKVKEIKAVKVNRIALNHFLYKKNTFCYFWVLDVRWNGLEMQLFFLSLLVSVSSSFLSFLLFPVL